MSSVTITLSHGTDETPTKDELEFYLVMQKCFDKFVERNRKRHGVWRLSGMRGQVWNVFSKAERAYVDTFVAGEAPDIDHFEDVVNYAIFALILLKDREARVNPNAAPTVEEFKSFMNGTWPR